MPDLTYEQLQVVAELLGSMNHYEMCAILCKTNKDTEVMDSKVNTLVHVYTRITGGEPHDK
jgi:hypothetical protein